MNAKKKTKVLILDDHRLFVDGLMMMLNRFNEAIEVTARYRAKPVLDHIDFVDDFDLVLVDLQMPGLDGFAFLEAIQKRKPGVKCVIISGTDKFSDIQRAISLGAMAFIPKSGYSDNMMKGIKMALNGERYVPSELMSYIDWNERYLTKNGVSDDVRKVITLRQMEVLKLVHKGLSNKDIASILGISESAIKSHISALFKTLGARNRTSCVKTAIDMGLLSNVE